MFLLDTNVLSELRKDDRCDARVAAWYARIPDADLFISVVVTGEIRKGVERLRSRDPRQAEIFARWLQEIQWSYADRILPIDARVADVGAGSVRSAPFRSSTLCLSQPPAPTT